MTSVSDASLTWFLNLEPEEAAQFLPSLTPEKRAIYEKMYEVYQQVIEWEQGRAEKPKGVFLD